MNDYQKALLDAATQYWSKGLSVIPISPEDKVPLIAWKKYQHERASIPEIEAWVQEWPNMNLGLVTGSVSGIAVVDIEAGGNSNDYEATAKVKTGRGGYHLYYRVPEGQEIPSKTRALELTDIRGEGGYVVAPPSKTEDSYRWEIELASVASLPVFPLRLLPKVSVGKERLDWKEIAGAGIKEGKRNESLASFLGGILPSLTASEFETVAWPIAKGLNQTFDPPMDEKEVRAVFESIATRESARREESSEEMPFEAFSLADLYKKDLPVKWLVHDLIPLDAITAITGDSNSFKTFITQALAANVADGEPFLGHFPVEARGPVLIVDEENSQTLLKKRFRDLGVPESADIRFLSFRGFRADSERSIKRLKEVVDALRPTLIVLDSLVDIHSRNENDGIEMAGIFNALRKNILTPDSALVVIHHRRKTQAGQGGNVGQNIRGSTGIRGAIDAHLAIDRKGKNDARITQDKLRVQEQLDPFLVSLVPTENGQVAFSYQGRDQEHQEAINDLQAQIIGLLAGTTDDWKTAGEMAEALEVPRKVFDQAAAGLLSTERLIKRAGARNKTLLALAPVVEETQSDDSVS